MKTAIVFFYVTFPNEKSAQKIAKIMLKKKLIACANIFPKIKSVYIWNKKITSNSECICIFKTEQKLCKKLEIELKKTHPYSVPCLAQIKLNGLNQAYKKWLMGTFEPQ